MEKAGRVVAFALFGMLLLLSSDLERERMLDSIVLFRGDARDFAAIESAGAVVLDRFNIINGARVSASEGQLESIGRLPSVEGVYPNRILRPMLAQSVPLIGASIAQGQGYTGSGIKIAIVDTGVNATDSRVSGRVINQSDCTQSTCQNNNPAVNQDSSGHGTQMAIIAAGSAGVATAASIIDVKVAQAAGGGGASESDVVKGIDYALSPDGLDSTRDGVDIILLSFGVDIGGSYCAGPASAAIDNAVSRGVSVIVANGDTGCVNGTMYPACSRKATAVGSTTDAAGTSALSCPGCVGGTSDASADAWFCGSGRGVDKWEGKMKPDVVAPGYSINISSPEYGTMDSSYAMAHSSSIAAAHVAGASAILMQKIKANWGSLKDPNPDTAGINSSTAALKAILLNSANELGSAGRDERYGAGRLNVTAGLSQANSTYVQYCNRWYSGEISPAVNFYHNISVPSGAGNVSVTLYWEENNRTTHKNLDLTLKDPSLVAYSESSPTNDVVRQIRVSSPSSGTWYAVVENVNQLASKYVVVSNYPLGDCQPPTLTTVSIVTYNGTTGTPHTARNDFFPSNHYDWLEEYDYGTQVVQYVITMYDQFGQVFEHGPGTTISISYQNGSSNGEVNFAPVAPTSTGTYTSWVSGNYISLPPNSGATYTGIDWPQHRWYLNALVSGCGLGCPKSASQTEFYVNKTYGQGLSVSGPSTTRYDTPAYISVNISNLGNVGDKYTVRAGNNFTANAAGIGSSGRCTFNLVTNPVSADYIGVGSTNIEVIPDSTLTGGDYCWMDYVNATSENAFFLVKNTTRDNGWARKVESFASPMCDGLPLNFSAGRLYAYFTYTPTEGDIYVKETDLAIRAFPDTTNWKKADGKVNFSLYYAKDDNGDFVPNNGESYQLAFTRTSSSQSDDTLSQIEVNSTQANMTIGQLMQFYQSSMGYKRFLLRQGQRYSFKMKVLDGDLFQLAVTQRAGENATGGCDTEIIDNTTTSPGSCLCTVGSAFAGGTVIARFFGHDATYGFSQVSGVGLYINDTISFLTDINYKSQVCEGELDVDSYCRPKFGSMPIYRNSTKMYFRAYPKTHNLPNDMVQASNWAKGATVSVSLYDGNNTLVNAAAYSLSCSTLPCKSSATMAMPHYNSLGQVAKVGVWSANFSASAQYFTPASQATTFTVKGVTNVSITGPQTKYYRGTNYTFNSTVRNEFGDVEDPLFYNVAWELRNSTGSKLINTSKDFRYVFTEEVGLVNISANASGTYLDASNQTIAAELWDRLNSSITIVPDPDYQLGSYLNFSMNVTRALGEPVVSGIEVVCNVTAANRGNGSNVSAGFSGGLWTCRQQLDKETVFIGSSLIKARSSGNYYEANTSSRNFTILGANISAVVSVPAYAYMGANFTLRINITNRGNWNGSNAHFNLTLPTELVRLSGNWSERDVNDSEALGHNIQVGESFNYSWVVNASSVLGNYTLNLSITADNGPTVLVVSALEVKSTMNLSFQSSVTTNATVPLNISANISNAGDFNITGANVSLVLPADVQITGGNQSYRFDLGVGGNRSLVWEVSTDLGGNFTLVFNVTSDNAGALVRNMTLVTANRLKVSIVSPASGLRANVSDYQNFTAILNITHNRSIVADLSQQNFSATIGSYTVAITNVTFDNGLWNVTMAAPQQLNESLNYDLGIRVLYFNSSINRSYDITSTSYGAVHSIETIPAIFNIAMPSSFSVGNQTRINVSVYDKSALAYLSGTFLDSDGNSREYNFSLVSASGYYKNYTYLFVPAIEGPYNITINAMDWYGTNSSNMSNFSVYGPPRIRNIFFPASRYLILGENVTMVVNATSHVSAITVRVNISNGTVETTYDTVPDPLGYNLTRNFTDLGTYYVNAFVNDTYGNMVNYSDSFTISGQVSLSGNFSLNGNVSLNPAGTADPRIIVTGIFSAAIPSGTYDLYARTADGNLTVRLNSVSLSATTSGKTIAITPATINSSVFLSRTAYDISTNFTYPSVLLGFKYPSSYNSTRVYLYKCSSPAWNNSICNGNWTRLATTVDANATTAYSTVTGLSGFSVGLEHLLSGRIRSVNPSTGVMPGMIVNLTFNVSLDGSPQETKITPRVWFDYAELNSSGHVAAGYIHNVSVTAAPITSLKRNVILDVAYQEPGAADYITTTDTLVEGVSYFVSAYCGDGSCDVNESCGSCSADCGVCGSGPGGGSGYTIPLLSNYTPPQPALVILDYPSAVSVAAGNSTTRSVSVRNVGNIPVNVSLKFDELTLWITSPGNKKILLNGSETFSIDYSIPSYAQPGVYQYSIKAVANNFYNTTLAIKSAQLTITAAAPIANVTPPANTTPFTPPSAESRYTELKGSYQKTKNDITKLGVLGYNISSPERELIRVEILLDEAAENISSSQAPEKLDLASAKLDSVRDSAKGIVAAKYSVLLAEKPEYTAQLSEAEAALNAGDFGKAAYLLDSIGKKQAASITPTGTSIVYSIVLIAILLAIGGAGYYKKEEIMRMVEDVTRVSMPLQVEDVYSRSKVLVGKYVSLKGTIIASGAREGGFWIKMKDRTGEMLVWSREDRSLGELVEVRGIVTYDRSIDLWYVDARILKGSSTKV